MSLDFESPWLLLLLIFGPLLCCARDGMPLFGRRRTARLNGLLFSAPVGVSDLPVAARVRERPFILNTMRLLGFSCLVIALARPQTGITFSETEESGRDIMLSLDTSGSMAALDFSIDRQRVNRLAALKHVMTDFVDARKGDRMGLIVFGSDVFTQCPLTMDQDVLKDFVSRLEIGMVGEGTALGDAIAVSVKRLRDIKANSKVLVLVTDGVRTAGSLDPIEAAQLAAKAGIKIYSIGIGGNKPAPFPVRGIFGETRLDYRPVELDEKTLQAVAQLTGGEYYNAQKTEALEDIYRKISELEERVEKSYEYVEYHEQYLGFALCGLFLFLIHEMLAATRYSTLQ